MQNSFPDSQKKAVKVFFKHEGNSVGPVYLIEADGNESNFRDSDQEMWDGIFFPEWFTLANAKKIAKQLGLPLEQY